MEFEPPTLLEPLVEALPPVLPDFPPVSVPASLVPASLFPWTIVAEKDEQPVVSEKASQSIFVEVLRRGAKGPSIWVGAIDVAGPVIQKKPFHQRTRELRRSGVALVAWNLNYIDRPVETSRF